MTGEEQAVQGARELLAATSLFEELGLSELAVRARVIARDVLELAEALATERSARQAIQEARDRCVDLLAQQAYEAIARRESKEPACAV